MLGPGGGHVGEPLPFLGLGGLVLEAGLAAAAPVGVQVQVQPRPARPGGLPAATQLGQARLDRRLALPEVGADHHRVFQALAAIHRDHRNRRLGRIAMELVVGGHGTVLSQPQAAQPVGRRRRPQLLPVHAFLHQLGGLHQVGQEPAPQG